MTSDRDRNDDGPGGDALAIALRRGLGALGDAAMPVPDLDLTLDLALDDVPRLQRSRRRLRLVATSGLVTAAAVLIGLFAIGQTRSDDGFDMATTTLGGTGWERVAEGPLTERNHATLVWTGREVIVAGGDTFVCGGDCDEPIGPLLTDGAAYAPATDSWRTIADAPVGFAEAPGVMVGDDLYQRAFSGGRDGAPTLLRYSLTTDSWAELAMPAQVGPLPLLAAGSDLLVAYPDSVYRAEGPGWLLDPATGDWSPLPPDPLGPSAERTMIWVGNLLWLFATPADPAPGQPPLAEVARYDPETEQWERGATSDMYTTGPWLREGSVLINPTLGCVEAPEDGRRCVPRGGWYDTATDTWSHLPDEPEAGSRVVASAGAVGTDEALFLTAGAHLLDAPTGRWQTLPTIPGDGTTVERQLLGAGLDAFAFGSASDNLALGDGWIWRSGRQVDPGPGPTDPTPIPTSVARTSTSRTVPSPTLSSASSVSPPTSTSTTTSTTSTTTASTPTPAPPSVLSWKDDPVVARSPVCVPGELPLGLDVTKPIHFWQLGDPTSRRLDLITASAVYTAVDCGWVPILDLRRVPGEIDWRCQQYEDGSEIQQWDFRAGTVSFFPAGGSAPIADYQRPGLLFGIASCDPDDPANAAPGV